MKFLISNFPILSVFLLSCATPIKSLPTEFIEKGKGLYGYSIQGDEEDANSLLAIFEGNSATPPQLAKAYSILTAIDFCRNKGQSSQFIGPSVDFTEESHSTKIGAYSVPTSYMGNPATPSLPLVYSYPVKVLLPKVATPFRCGKKFPMIASEHDLEPLSRELVHPIVRDFRGGVMVRASEDSQIKSHGLFAGDVILSVGKQRVETIYELSQALASTAKNPVQSKILRNGKVREIELKFIDAIDRVRVAETRLLSESCTIVAENHQQVRSCLQ